MDLGRPRLRHCRPRRCLLHGAMVVGQLPGRVACGPDPLRSLRLAVVFRRHRRGGLGTGPGDRDACAGGPPRPRRDVSLHVGPFRQGAHPPRAVQGRWPRPGRCRRRLGSQLLGLSRRGPRRRGALLGRRVEGPRLAGIGAPGLGLEHWSAQRPGGRWTPQCARVVVSQPAFWTSQAWRVYWRRLSNLCGALRGLPRRRHPHGRDRHRCEGALSASHCRPVQCAAWLRLARSLQRGLRGESAERRRCRPRGPRRLGQCVPAGWPRRDRACLRKQARNAPLAGGARLVSLAGRGLALTVAIRECLVERPRGAPRLRPLSHPDASVGAIPGHMAKRADRVPFSALGEAR
mmetsp:Transcript_40284/g.85924  ORF Transcript_40284/g.85924 Transcript_40284/m.85924 type:complete len:347 (-) Transcript_40284:507-1547(-)